MYGLNYHLIMYMLVVLTVQEHNRQVSLKGLCVDSRKANSFPVCCHLRCSLDGNLRKSVLKGGRLIHI